MSNKSSIPTHEKRMFQILDEMNINDEKNNTAHLGVCDYLVQANTARGGGHVTMGVPASVVHDLVMGNNKTAILLIIDKSEYDKIKSKP